ncbi:MAG: hypothetical protein CSA62_14630 [Planctomycetota bacterium]|nr:MAG: hypothetical protein CSA62_14630 [Planctomycetota bacterium]
MRASLQGLPPVNELHSLHPFTLIFDALAAMRVLAVPTLLLFTFSSGSFRSFVPLVIAAGLQIIIGSMRFASMRYGIHGSQLVIQEGILSRRVRTIPIRTIQNIFLKRNLLHRILGVCELRVETAGGGKAEARLSVVAEEDAQSLRRGILARAEAGGALAGSADLGTAKEPEPTLLRRSGLGELFLAGATANRAGALVLVLLGLLEFADEFGDKMKLWLEIAADYVLGQLGDDPVVLAAFALLLLILLGWIVAIFLTLLRYYGFELRRTPDGRGLHRRQGLFTQFEGVLPRERIQVLRVEANPPQRLLSCAIVRAETAGSVQEKESAGSTTLCPLLWQRELGSFCRAIFEDLDFSAIELQPVHRAALRRGFVRFLLGLGLLAILLSQIFELQPWWLLGAALLASGPLALLRYWAMGWALEGGFLISRGGIWNRKHWVVPVSRVQTLSIVQSPTQRVLRIATLRVDTAGALRFQSARILDLPLSTARRLYEELARGAALGAAHDGL